MIVGGQPPEISIDELAPASTALNPCKPEHRSNGDCCNCLLAMSAI
jgi:hypothetical protein